MTAQEYLKEHGISEEFAGKFGLTWDNNYLHIPIRDQKTEWLKSRNLNHETNPSTPKYLNEAGSKASIFNLERHINTKVLVLTEGEIDALKLEQEGIAAISLTSGAGKFDEALAQRLADKKLYVCYDNDSAGQKGLEKVLALLPETKIIRLPDNTKDICDFFSKGYTKKDFTSIKPQTHEDWLSANEPEEFALIEGTDLIKRDIPKEEWLIERIIPTEGFTFIVGAEATGKSFITLTLAQALTTSQKWLGEFEVKKTTNILFIDKENTKRRTQTRMKGLGISGENMFWLEYPQYFEMTSDKEEDGFSPFIKAIARKVKKHDIGLIFVDSFADVMIGNENAAADTQRFFDGFRQLFPGISILVLHHENKPQQGVARSSSQRFRGSTNITAQIIVGFRMEAIFKNKGEFTMEQTKVGDAEKLNKFKIKMNTIVDPEDANKTIVKALDYGGEVLTDLSAVEEAAEYIVDYLTNNMDQRRKDVVDAGLAMGHTRPSLDRALDMLKEKKIVSSKTNPQEKREKFLYISVGEEDENDSLDPNSLFDGNL